MKSTIYLLLGASLLLSGAAMATDEPKFRILNQTEDFELRRYNAQIVAQTWVTGSQMVASNKGFKTLANYIFGNNTAPTGESSKISMTTPVMMQPNGNDGGQDKSAKIAMTAPVNMQHESGQWRVQFVMPSQYTMQTLPKPNNADITIAELPVQTYGVIKFSGLAGENKVAEKTKALQEWMQAQNLTMIGTPELARYNPPWILPFMRRNEIMIAYQP